MDLGLAGKVALVTASSKGLGRASALALSQEGAKVVLCARDERALASAAAEMPGETLAVPAAVSDPAEDAGGRAVAVGAEAAVGHRLLDDHPPAGRPRLGQGRAGRRLEQVPGRLHARERGQPGLGDLQGPADGVGLGGPAG